VRVMDLPLVLRVASLPDPALAPRGARVRVAVEGVDLLAAEIRVRFVEVLAGEIVEVDVVEAGEEAGSELEAAVIEVAIDTASPVDKDAASEG
jgi:hypothetical protein